MTNRQRHYKKKIKKLQVDFYLKDQELYTFAKSINFQAFVKEALKHYYDYDLYNTTEDKNNAIQ